MESRGPGLHHIAIDVPNILEFMSAISGSGWYIHPATLNSFLQAKTLFLARPNNPFLVEVQEVKEVEVSELFVERIRLTTERTQLIAALRCPQIELHSECELFINDGSLPLSAFY